MSGVGSRWMRVVRRLLPVAGIVWLAVACGGRHAPRPMIAEADTVRPRHATLLRYIEGPGWEVAEVLNPWQPAGAPPLRRYLLLEKAGVSVPQAVAEGATVVRVPLRRAVVCSTVYASLLADLDRLSAVVGLTDVAYALAPDVRRALAGGRMADVGSSVPVPDVERVMGLHPDGLLVSAFEQADYGAWARQSEVPLVVCADYMETSPLGRAEWMSFFGRLFGCRDRADSLFRQVEEAYGHLRRLAARVPGRRPSVLHDKKDGATWFVPGRRSTVGQMQADAGGRYLYPDSSSRGSVALDFERVFASARQADVWVIKYGASADLTRASLAADYPPYRHFTAWQRGRLFGCNTLRVPYYDETPFHPDRLLADWMQMLHPGLLPHHNLRYFSPLK